MSPNVHGPIPLEALRDLIGVCRAIYSNWKSNGAGPFELDELLVIGRDLQAALDLAKKTPPNTIGHRAAWSRAEQATQRLGHLIAGTVEGLRPTVDAAVKRVVSGGEKPPTLSEREAKRLHEKLRR